MEQRSAAATERVERVPRLGGTGHSRRAQTVGEYVGQRASEAAQAVRCAGLKPGLDRSFGHASELFGSVVRQEPTPGSELARSGLVTLYVAAPGAGPSGEDTAAQPPTSEAAAHLADDREPESSTRARARRRRKSRAGARSFGGVDLAPAPRRPAPTEQSQSDTLHDDEIPREDERGGAGESWPAGDREPCAEDLAADELVVRAEELFADHNKTLDWRRVYPRRTVRRSALSRLRGRPWPVRVVLGSLALWLVVAVAAAVSGHHAPQPARESTRPSATTAGHSESAARQLARTRSVIPAPARRSSASRSRSRRHVDARGRRTPSATAWTAVRRARARVDRASVSPAPTRAHAQGQGGPFSP
jgi:hypothetical protein